MASPIDADNGRPGTQNADGYYGLGGSSPIRQDHGDLRHRPHPTAAAAAAQAERHHGDPGWPPGQHVILKIVKQQNPDGSIQVARANVYNKVVPFVPFTKLVEESIRGTHDGTRAR